MANAAESMRKLRTKKKIQGICQECPRRSGNNRLCDQCKTRYQDRLRRWKLMNQAESKDYPLFRKNSKIKNHVLANVMKEKNVRLSNLANEVEVSLRQVERWLYEQVYPKEENAIRVGRYLGVGIEDVFPNYYLEENR